MLMTWFRLRDARRRFLPISVPALAIAALAAGGTATPASADSLAQIERQCLSCHEKPGLEMKLGDGETLNLHVSGDAFAQSAHAKFGCAVCHTELDMATHPKVKVPIESRRAFSIGRSEVCAGCHTDQAGQWKNSVHAALVQDGSKVAPVCTSCHSPHTVTKGAAEAMDTVPCKKCHDAIFTAYAGSVHGALRGAGITEAPLCFSCHGAHDVKVPTSGAGMSEVCLGCHTKILVKHEKWLPNTQLHFSVVSCPACHSPTAHRKVDLTLYNSTTQAGAGQPVGVPEFEGPAGSSAAGQTGLDPKTLFNLLRALNRPGVGNKTSIKGRLDVRTGVEAHELAPASDAIKDCNTCHRAGADAFQSVTVSVAGPAGIPIHYGVSKDVLRSAFSIDAIGGFYAIGGTRITFLDILLVLALLGGFGLPALHFTVRWLARQSQKHEQEDKKEG